MYGRSLPYYTRVRDASAPYCDLGLYAAPQTRCRHHQISAACLNENIFGTPGTRSVVLTTATLPRSMPRDTAAHASPTLRQRFYPCGRPEEYHMQRATPAPAQPAPLATGARSGRLAPARPVTPAWVSVRFNGRQHLSYKKLNKIMIYIIYPLYFLCFGYPARRRIAGR